jgi:Tfp pilus assembly protein PilW
LNGPSSRRSLGEGGFTLVELIVGTTLSAMVMAAVLSSYIYLGRSYGRLANQQILETEARRTLQRFTMDVQSATGISGTPSATSVTFTIPTSTGTTTTVAYAYDSTAGTFTRTPAGGTTLVLLRYITTSGLTVRYYDSSNNEYTTATLSAGSYLAGIKQLSLEFSTQTRLSTSGAQSVSNANGTQTQVYRVASGRLLIHNSALLQ